MHCLEKMNNQKLINNLKILDINFMNFKDNYHKIKYKHLNINGMFVLCY